MMENSLAILQWIMVIGSSLILWWVSPRANTLGDFFKGSKNDRSPNSWVLVSSLVISWLFAKSITNAANLGQSFGIVGGFAYACYYFSFLTAGVIIYNMRTKGGITSIHAFLTARFGKIAVMIFSLLLAIRLVNEVWSNTMVIGSYFGVDRSLPYYAAIIVFTLLTVAYTLKGGLRSSLLTDLIQMGLFAFLLIMILAFIFPAENMEVGKFIQSGSWTLAGGLNLAFAALLQVFSYPFHDPIMTDRGFITPPKQMLRSFILAGFIGGLCIILFSTVGVFAGFKGLSGQAPVEVAKYFGATMMLVMNLIMVTSAASTLDSTFTSFSKLWIIDLKFVRKTSISAGRKAILGIMLVGSIPAFLGAEILSATTVSGTMVLGLSPIFIFWKVKAEAWSFYLPVIFCLILGIVYATNLIDFSYIDGKYGDLLSVNIIGFVVSICLFWLPIRTAKWRKL